MPNAYQSLDQHIALLQHKGYTESALNLSYAPDTIKDLLATAYSEYSRLIELTGRPEHFVLVLPGRFDKAQDLVEYRMMYRLDPREEGMHLFAMAAQMDELRKLHIIGPRGEIDAAADMYQRLVNTRTRKVVDWLTTRNVKPLTKSRHL